MYMCMQVFLHTSTILTLELEENLGILQVPDTYSKHSKVEHHWKGIGTLIRNNSESFQGSENNCLINWHMLQYRDIEILC